MSGTNRIVTMRMPLDDLNELAVGVELTGDPAEDKRKLLLLATKFCAAIVAHNMRCVGVGIAVERH